MTQCDLTAERHRVRHGNQQRLGEISGGPLPTNASRVSYDSGPGLSGPGQPGPSRLQPRSFVLVLHVQANVVGVDCCTYSVLTHSTAEK